MKKKAGELEILADSVFQHVSHMQDRFKKRAKQDQDIVEYLERKRVKYKQHRRKMSKKHREIHLDKKRKVDELQQQDKSQHDQYYKWYQYYVRSVERSKQAKEKNERERRQKITRKWQLDHDTKRKALKNGVADKIQRRRKYRAEALQRSNDVRIKRALSEGAGRQRELQERLQYRAAVKHVLDSNKIEHIQRIKQRRKEELLLKHRLKRISERAKYVKSPKEMDAICREVLDIKQKLQSSDLGRNHGHEVIAPAYGMKQPATEETVGVAFDLVKHNVIIEMK
eukprot:jgi/Bigna1/139371/aug1.50_g14079